MTQAKEPKRSLFRRAFSNQYNFIFLAGTALFTIATLSFVPLIVGVSAELLWLILGSDSSLFRRWVAIQDGKERQVEVQRRAQEALRSLGPEYLQRFQALEQLGEEIKRLAGENPSLETQLVQSEMDKLGQLLHTFLQLAVVHQRLSGYLQESFETEIQRDIDRCNQAMKKERNAEVLSTLRQSLSLAQRRMEQHANIEATYKVVSVKMDTLEKSFQYLKSHVLAVASQEELAKEIDDLITGVEAVESLDSETEGLISDLGRARAARQALKG